MRLLRSIFVGVGALAVVACLGPIACSGDDTTSNTTPTKDASTGDTSNGGQDSASGVDSAHGEDSSVPDASGDGGSGEAGPLSFNADVYTIVTARCISCHGPLPDGGDGSGVAFGKLDMRTEAAAYANLVGDGGVVAAGSKCAALGADAGLKRVVAGNPTDSLLYNKLASNDGDGGTLLNADGGPAIFCGSPMPLHLPAVSASQLAKIHDWIQAGANP
jgi:hypothetical protein